jgi:hypothetical protein
MQQIRELEGRLSSLRPKTSKFSFAKSKTSALAIKSDKAIVACSSSISAGKVSDGTMKVSGGDGIRFENRSGERLTLAEDFTSSTVILTNLAGCIIDLRPAFNRTGEEKGKGKEKEITAVHAQNLDKCILYAPIDGSILLHSITSCILIISSHQVRLLILLYGRPIHSSSSRDS